MTRLSGLWPVVFNPVHNAIKADSYDFYWLAGGRGSGKSSYISLEIISGLIKDPMANAVVYRKIAGTLGDSVFRQMTWAVARLGLWPWFRAKTSPYRLIYLPTEQEVLFFGCDDPQKSKSIKPRKGYFRYCWFEELTDFRGLAEVETVVQSVARGGPGRTAVLASYNPPRSAGAWVNAEAERPSAGRLVHHSTYKDVPEALLGPQFIRIAEMMRMEDELKWRNVYMGEVTGAGGEVFANIERRRITDEETARFDKIYTGLDFGFAVDPTAAVRMCYDPPGKTLYIFAEFWGVKASYDLIAEKLRAMGGGRVTADSAEPRSVEELRARGIPIEGAKKGPGSVDHGIRRLQDLKKIVIDPERCPNTAREFAGYEYETDRYGQFVAAYPDRDNHTIDAVRYGLEKVFRGRAFSFD